MPGVVADDGLRTADGRTVAGRTGGVDDGEPAVAVFPPTAVAVYTDKPSGSPRNVLPVRLAAFGAGGRPRAAAGAAAAGRPVLGGLGVDVTAAAVADLAVEPGADLWFVVKAAEVGIHGVGGA